MVKTVLNSFLNMSTFEEDFFSNKIIAGKYEIYPYYTLEIIYSPSNSPRNFIANASINPLAIVIFDKTDDEYFLYLFDENKKEDEAYITEILEKFVDFSF